MPNAERLKIIQSLLAGAAGELQAIDARRAEVLERIEGLKQELQAWQYVPGIELEDGIRQTSRWMNSISYTDSCFYQHWVNVMDCIETAQHAQDDEKTSKHKWVTNFTLTSGKVT